MSGIIDRTPDALSIPVKDDAVTRGSSRPGVRCPPSERATMATMLIEKTV